MTQKSELGAWGEKIACAYLVEKGYRVLETNAKEKWGELDIVAVSRDKTLVFVEVKTVSEPAYGNITAENQITFSKMTKFQRTASLYAGSHQELIKDKKGWRLDVIAITKFGEKHEVRHYENV